MAGTADSPPTPHSPAGPINVDIYASTSFYILHIRNQGKIRKVPDLAYHLVLVPDMILRRADSNIPNAYNYTVIGLGKQNLD